MLTDAAIKALKPQSKMYKVSDRDGMYVGVIAFRSDLVSAQLSPERAARDRLSWQVRPRRNLAGPRT